MGASPITPPVRHMARRRLAPTRWLQIWPRNFVRTISRLFRSGWAPSILNVHARTLLLSRKTRSPSSDENHRDRKSTRLNSSHVEISYAVFCLKQKKNTTPRPRDDRNRKNQSQSRV